MNKNKEIAGYIVIFLMGLVFTIKAYLIPAPFLQQDVNTTPAFFPLVAGIIFTSLSLILIISFLTQKQKNVEISNKETSLREFIPSFTILATLLIYIVLMQVFGWLLCSMLMVGIVLIIAGKSTVKQKLRPWVIVLFSVMFTVAVFLLFDFLLDVPLPRGLWSLEILLGI